MNKKSQHSEEASLSDIRISNAMKVLQSSNRGLHVLAQFRQFVLGEAIGLDAAGFRALVLLVKEFAAGRRDFVNYISPVVLPPKPQDI